MKTRAQHGLIRAAGFTLVEIMIALLIGIIGIVVMMQTFAVSEGFKRTATSGTDAQINGGVALYMLQRELRLAGFGMNVLMTEGCSGILVWRNTTSSTYMLPIAPFMINPPTVPAGDANTDTVLIMYGMSSSAVAGIPVQSTQTPDGNGPIALAWNWDALQTGDLIVAYQPGATPSCVLHEATGTINAGGNCGYLPPGGAASNQVGFGMTAYQQHTPTGCVATTPMYNKSTVMTDLSGVAVPALVYAQGLVFDLGNPAIHVYAVRNGILTMCDWVASDCTNVANYTSIVDGIVSLRAVYGMNLTPSVSALPGDNVVVWNRNDITTNVFLPSRVQAVAMEITARSSLKEKVNAAGVCATTPVASRPDLSQNWLYQSMAGAGIDLSAISTDWACYRYKLFQTSVPLRNTIWRP